MKKLTGTGQGVSDVFTKLVSPEVLGKFGKLMKISNEEFAKGTRLQEEAARRMKGFNAQIDILNNNWIAFKIRLGDLLLPVLKIFVKVITDIANEISKLDPITRGFIIILTALGGVATIVTAKLVLLKIALLAMGTTLKAVGVFLLPFLIPFAIIIGIILVLIGVAILLRKAFETNFGGLRDIVFETINVFKIAFKDFMNFMQLVFDFIANEFGFFGIAGIELADALDFVFKAIFKLLQGLVFLIGLAALGFAFFGIVVVGLFAAIITTVKFFMKLLIDGIEAIFIFLISSFFFLEDLFTFLGDKIGDFFVNIFNAPKEALISLLNFFGRNINRFLIGGLNEILPGFLQIETRIPELQEGAFVTGPTLATIGEGGESEIVAPESKFERLIEKLVRRLGGAGGGVSGTLVIPITLEVDGRVLASVVREFEMENLIRSGQLVPSVGRGVR